MTELDLARSRAPDLDELLGHAVRETARLVGASGAMLYLYDPATDLLRWAFDAGISDERELAWVRSLEVPLGVGMFGRAVATNSVLTTGDYPADTRFVHAQRLDRFVSEVDLRSLIVVPMISGDGPLGALGAYSRQARAFDETHVALVTALAGHAAIAIENARLIRSLDASRAELAHRAAAERALRGIAANITAMRDPAGIRQRVVEESCRLLGTDVAHLALIEDDHLGSVAIAGDLTADERDWILAIRVPVGAGLTSLVLERGTVLTSRDLSDTIQPSPGEIAFTARLRLRDLAIAPLRVSNRVIGMLAVFTRTPREFRADELELLQGLADQAAIAFENARLFDEQLEAAERFELLTQRSPDLVWILDHDERFTYFSDRLEAFTAYRPDEFLGKPLQAIVHPASLAGFVEWLDGIHAAIAEGRLDPAAEQRMRFALRHRSGRPVPVEMRSVGLVADGVQRGWQAAVRDMSELDRLEGELRTSEERYRSLTENSPDVVWLLDLDDRITFISSRVETLTGRPPADYVGRPAVDAAHEESRASLAARFAKVNADIAAGRIDPLAERRYRFSLTDRDEMPVPVELRSVGLVVDGVLRGWQGSVRDMRELDRLERGLRESEERFRLLTERSPDLVLALDASARITYVSGRVEALIGWSPGELLGRPAVDFLHPGSLREVRARWRDRRRHPDIEQLYRITVRHRDGRPIPVEMRSVGIVVDGEFRGEQSSLRDMRERDRMERELRRHAAELAASQERAHLAQELHDSVTQALFSMTLTTRSAEMLLRRDPDAAAEKLAELRELGKDALTEMRSLIFELRPGSLEQDGLLVALRKHAAAVQGRTGLPVVAELDECPRLPAEIEESLYRVAQEALHNVIKHARASEVRIELAIVDDGLRMRIADDGRGFDAGHRPAGGHLGLAGMAARAERVGATFAVRSQPGRGTTIEVVVPRALIVEGTGAAPSTAVPSEGEEPTSRGEPGSRPLAVRVAEPSPAAE